MDSAEVWGEEDGVTAEVANLTAAELRMRTSLVDSELKYFKSEANKLKFELNNMQVLFPSGNVKYRRSFFAATVALNAWLRPGRSRIHITSRRAMTAQLRVGAYSSYLCFS